MRNHYLDLLKFLSIIIVSFWHTGWWTSLHHGYLPVEFFFIISGYFIYRTSKREKSLACYTKKKFLRLYPTYIIIFVVYLVLALLAPTFYPGIWKANIPISVLREVTMMVSTCIFEMTGMPLVVFNSHAWYVSSFFFGGIVIYSVSRFRRGKVFIFSSIATLFYLWILFISEKGLNGYWGYESVFFIPLWRGIAGMSIGALIGIFNENVKIKEYVGSNISVFNIFTVLCLISCFVCCFIDGDFDWIGILCFIIVFVNLLQSEGLSVYFHRCQYARYVPDISLEILLIHKFTIILTAKILTMADLLGYDIIKYISYFVITVSSALIIKKIIVPTIVRIYNSIPLPGLLQLR